MASNKITITTYIKNCLWIFFKNIILIKLKIATQKKKLKNKLISIFYNFNLIYKKIKKKKSEECYGLILKPNLIRFKILKIKLNKFINYEFIFII